MEKFYNECSGVIARIGELQVMCDVERENVTPRVAAELEVLRLKLRDIEMQMQSACFEFACKEMDKRH